MPIAAVPKYLEQDFTTASPGMRFSLYLPIWTERADQERQIRKMVSAKSRQGQELAEILHREGMDAAIAHANAERGRFPHLWEKNDHGAKDAWTKVKSLRKKDQDCMRSLLDRQTVAFETTNPRQMLRLEALANAPFTTGLGNEHPLENGFAFLWPYGLPYLPGSSVKGVLRQAARELIGGEWGDAQGWSQVAINALFGLESNDGDQEHLRGALSFWDVMPQIPGNSLAVEIMTPHQSHYYQQKSERKNGDIVSPHDSGQPIPISFLTLPPGSGFTFHVACDLAHLRRTAPELAENDQWKTLIIKAFEHAFQWLGFGAKTAVGYGAMRRDTEAENRLQKEREAREAKARAEEEVRRKAAQIQAEREQMSPVERSIHTFLDERPDKNQPVISAVIQEIKQGRWQGEEKLAVAQWLKAEMQKQGQWKESSQAKKPEKDKPYQNTLLVKSWLEGQ